MITQLRFSEFSWSLHIVSRKESVKKRKLKQLNKNTKPSLPFPMSKPTSLLLITKSNKYPETKFQALETVINEIDTSLRKGIKIYDTQLFASLLETCYRLQAYSLVSRIHSLISVKLVRENVGISSKLIRLYSSNGLVEEAHHLFDQMPERSASAFPWNSFIGGYADSGLYEDALALYFQMVEHVSSSVTNALIRFYSNHDKLKQGQWLFEQMPERDVVFWNSIISAHSKDAKALVYFRRMSSTGNVLPDAITFVSLLSTCAHLGMVDDGDMLWMMMKDKYKIKPIMEHYACMVYLYARAGLIDKAYDLIIKNIDIDPSPTLWGALLNGCYLHGDADIGEIVARTLFELEPDNEQNFVLLMKIYCSVNRMDDAQRVKTMMVERGLDV